MRRTPGHDHHAVAGAGITDACGHRNQRLRDHALAPLELATGGAAAIAMPVLAARHLASQAGGAQLAAIIVSGAVATALFAALGTGIGTVIRNQVGSIPPSSACCTWPGRCPGSSPASATPCRNSASAACPVARAALPASPPAPTSSARSPLS